MSDEHGLYWIAVNGASCALATWSMTRPQVSPVPEQMWGFPTYEEAKKAQDISASTRRWRG